MADTDLDNMDNAGEEEQPAGLSAAISPAAPKPAAVRPTVALPDPEAPSYAWIQKQKELTDKFAATATPEATSDLQGALDRADAAYKQKTDRNDWLEIAQNLSNAITRFGASQAGLRNNQDVSNIPLGAGINYEARNSRAMNEYLQEQKKAELLDAQVRRGNVAESAASSADYSRQLSPLKEGAQLAGKAESEGRITQRQKELTGERQGNREELESGKEQLRKTGMQSRSLGDQLRREQSSYDKEKQTADKVIGELPTLLQADDTGKEAAKLKAKYGDKLPGEDWAGLQDRLAKATKPGTFFGTNPDPEARKKILDDEAQAIRDKLQTHQSLIETLQQKRDALLSGESAPDSSLKTASPSQAPASAPAAPAAPQADKTVGPDKLQAYAQAHYAGDTAKAAAFLKQNGYKVIGQ